MSHFDHLLDRVATNEINERVQRRQNSHIPGQRRRTRRHALASGLRSLADRVEPG